jgi:anti-sigma regulatory factor (Ser/Thr protein kinase)
VTAAPARHNLFQYLDDGELVYHIAPFLRAGLEEHEAVVLVVDRRKLALMQQVLGDLLTQISYIDRDAFYTRPEAALAGYDAQVRRYIRDGAARVRVFGELPLCRTQEQADTWIMYEALLNPAFAHHPVTIVCGLDVREQPESVLEGSWHTHPKMLLGGWSDNDHYHDPAQVVRARTPAPAPVAGLSAVPLEGDLRELRVRLFDQMAAAQVPEVEAYNMLIAVGELLANARTHAGGARELRAGRAGDRFVCEISDHGGGFDDPLAGYLPPGAQNGGGAGLWVARQMTRGLELQTSERGLTARLWV